MQALANTERQKDERGLLIFRKITGRRRSHKLIEFEATFNACKQVKPDEFA